MIQVDKARGLTLVEVLVVIAILGVLIALLMPAIQSGREAARKTSCSNNLKQVALAWLSHEASQGFFPTGGWGWGWTGDPSRGANQNQPGGWVYNILPFAEQQSLHDIGTGATTVNQVVTAINQRDASAIAWMNCPSRRPAVPYPNRQYSGLSFSGSAQQVRQMVYTSRLHARGDYAANSGDPPSIESGGMDFWCGPATLAVADVPGFWDPMIPFYRQCTGVCFQRSRVQVAHVRDGLSTTYMTGERYCNPDNYFNGLSPSDDWSMYSGWQDDVGRSTFYNASSPAASNTPMQDTRGVEQRTRFGSAHAIGCLFAFCDGSVRMIQYTIDPWVNRCLGHRSDGQAVSGLEP